MYAIELKKLLDEAKKRAKETKAVKTSFWGSPICPPLFKKIDDIGQHAFKKDFDPNVDQMREILLAIIEYRESPEAKKQPWLTEFFDKLYSASFNAFLVEAIQLEINYAKLPPSNMLFYKYPNFRIIYSNLQTLTREVINPTYFLTAINARSRQLKEGVAPLFEKGGNDWIGKDWILILEKNGLLYQRYVDLVASCLDYCDPSELILQLIFLRRQHLLTLENIKILQNLSMQKKNPIWAIKIFILLNHAVLLEANREFFELEEEGDQAGSIYAINADQAEMLLSALESLDYSFPTALTQQAFDVLRLTCTPDCPPLSPVLTYTLKKLNRLTLSSEHKEQLIMLFRKYRDQLNQSGLHQALTVFSSWGSPTYLTQTQFEIIMQHEDKNRYAVALIMKRISGRKINFEDEFNQTFLKSVRDPSRILAFISLRFFFNRHFEENYFSIATYHAIFSEISPRYLGHLNIETFGQAEFDEMIRICGRHAENEPEAVHLVNQYLAGLFQEEGAQLTYKQSVHNVAVEKSAKQSAEKLFKIYREKIAGENLDQVLKDVQRWIGQLGGDDTHPLCLMQALPTIEKHPPGILSIITPEGLFQRDPGKNYLEYKQIVTATELRSLKLKRLLREAQPLSPEVMKCIDESKLSDQEWRKLDEFITKHPVPEQQGRTRTNQVLIDENAIAKRFFKRLHDPKDALYGFKVEINSDKEEFSVPQLLALIWVGLQDRIKQGQNQEDAYAKFLKGLHEIQRGYNLVPGSLDVEEPRTPGVAIEDDPAIKEDSPICNGGTFNGLVKILHSIHPDVEITFQSHTLALLECPLHFTAQLKEYLKSFAAQHNAQEALGLAQQLRKEIEEEKFTAEHWDNIRNATAIAMAEEFDILYQEHREKDPKLQMMLTSLADLCNEDGVKNALELFLKEGPDIPQKEKEKEVPTPRLREMPPLIKDEEAEREHQNAQKDKGKQKQLFNPSPIPTSQEKPALSLISSLLCDENGAGPINPEPIFSVPGAPALLATEQNQGQAVFNEKQRQKQLHIGHLEQYRKDRSEEAKRDGKELSKHYLHWYARFFGGFDGQTKDETAQYVIDLLHGQISEITYTSRHRAASKDRRLGRLIKAIIDDGLLTENNLEINQNKVAAYAELSC